MGAALERILNATGDPYSTVRDFKQKQGKKVFACYPMYVPEEIVHAAGLFPVVAWASAYPVVAGHSHIPPYNCGITRSFIDDLVNGRLDFIDGLVIPRLCLQNKGQPFVASTNSRLSYLQYLYLPHVQHTSATRDFLIEELLRFKETLESYIEKDISSEAIHESILLYNKNRSLLKQLYEVRRQKRGVITAREVQAIVQASMIMPKEEHNVLLEQIIVELKEAQPVADEGSSVVIYGSLCQAVAIEVLNIIEELGMIVIDDDLWTGSRYFANNVILTENPIEGLADRYLKETPPCPARGHWQNDWADYLAGLVQQSSAQGIITLVQKYCPPQLCYYPDIKRKLARLGIPEVLVELEHEVSSMEQVKTRLQSFSEILGGGI